MRARIRRTGTCRSCKDDFDKTLRRGPKEYRFILHRPLARAPDQVPRRSNQEITENVVTTFLTCLV
jgi:hypothetical protein